MSLSKIADLIPEEDFNRLDAGERQQVLDLIEYINTTGDYSIVSDIFNLDYSTVPVSPGEFINSHKYVGPYADSLYPKWKEELTHVLNPKNGITEWIVYGSIGTGKCLRDSTLVQTSNGIFSLKEIYSDFSEKEIDVLSESGFRNLASKHNEGVVPTIKVKTNFGRVIEGKEDHRLRVLTRGLEVVWKKLDELCKDDVLLLKPSIGYNNPDLPDTVAEGLGWVVAKGSRVLDSNGVHTGVSIDGHTSDRARILECAKGIVKYFNLRCSVKDVSHNCPDTSCRVNIYWGVNPSIPYMDLEDIFPQAVSQTQCIPKVIRKSGKRTWRYFLRGLFSGDGTTDKSGGKAPVLTTTSECLSEQVQAILTALGIYTSRVKYEAKLNGLKTSDAWGIRVVSYSSRKKFCDTIGFSGGVLPPVLKDILDGNLMFDTVKSIEDSTAHCYDLSVDGDPSYVANGFISHNTTVACVAQAYKLYLLNCMKCPQLSFGLAPHFPMFFAFFSTTKTKAGDAISSKFEAILNLSPYFRENLPKNQRKVFLQGAAGLFGPGYKEHPKRDDLFYLQLPHNINLLFGSRTSHALSLDVFSATLDEMNFRSKRSIKDAEDEDSAQQLYHQVRTRIESRFMSEGGMPGLIINISSARANDSFVESRIEEVRREGLSNVHISDFALWDVKPGKYSDSKFRVFVSSGFKSSRILKGDEVIPSLTQGEQIIEVPETFRPSFERNLDGAIRDLAGVATAAVDKLFKKPEIITQCVSDMPNPVYPEVLELGLGSKRSIVDYFDVDIVSHFDNVERSLYFYPDVKRFIHVDLAKNSDFAGVTCGCIPYFYEKKSTKVDSDSEVIQRLPFVFVDFMFGIKALKMDEIPFDEIRQFILWARDELRYPIVRATYDSWQSIHSMQLLKQNGLEAETLSVDKTDEPYMELLNAYSGRRILTPNHELLKKELKDLVYDISARTGRVDHPANGSKDIADSLAGMYSNALTYINKFGFQATGAQLVTEKIIESIFNKSSKYLKASRISKELGYEETILLDRGYDGSFYTGSRHI